MNLGSVTPQFNTKHPPTPGPPPPPPTLSACSLLANASSHGFYYCPCADADTQVNLSCLSSDLNLRIFSITPRYFYHPNVPQAPNTPRSSAPINQLFLLCSLEQMPPFSHLHKPRFLRNPSSSSHLLLRYLISSIYFVFVIILPFHSYYS